MNNEIVILSGASAVGKDTLANMLNSFGWDFVISHSTRPMRKGESDGNPYWFVTDDEFARLDLLEHRKYNTLVGGKEDIWHYGVSIDAIKPNKKYVVVLDVDGTLSFIKHFGNRVIPLYIFIDESERRRRSIERGDHDETEWERRLIDDNKVFSKNVIKDLYSWSFENVDSKQTVNDIMYYLTFY